MEGFYAIYYTGTAGFGHAVLIFKDETITGADATGGIYDGSYSIGDGTIDFQVDLSVPAGTTLVTGQTLSEPQVQNIKARLRDSFASGKPVQLETPMGPVNVIFKKLRDA